MFESALKEKFDDQIKEMSFLGEIIHIFSILFDCSNLRLLQIIHRKTYGNEALNRSNLFRWYSRFRDRKELVEDDERGGRPKSTLTEDCCCCWFGQKWPPNLSKNDSIIFKTPKTSSSDSERGFGKEKAVCTFRSTLLDTWEKGRSSHILPHYRHGRSRQKYLTKLLREMRPGVLPMTPKQRDRVLNG